MGRLWPRRRPPEAPQIAQDRGVRILAAADPATGRLARSCPQCGEDTATPEPGPCPYCRAEAAGLDRDDR